jgi:hypothetical protein
VLLQGISPASRIVLPPPPLLLPLVRGREKVGLVSLSFRIEESVDEEPWSDTS